MILLEWHLLAGKGAFVEGGVSMPSVCEGVRSRCRGLQWGPWVPLQSGEGVVCKGRKQAEVGAASGPVEEGPQRECNMRITLRAPGRAAEGGHRPP